MGLIPIPLQVNGVEMALHDEVLADYTESGYSYVELSAKYAKEMNEHMGDKQLSDLPPDTTHPFNTTQAKLGHLYDLYKNGDLPPKPPEPVPVESKSESKMAGSGGVVIPSVEKETPKVTAPSKTK